MKLCDEFTMTIGGQSAPMQDCFDVLNPATEDVIARVPDCSSEQLDDAVAAARSAYSDWKATPYSRRQNYLKAIAGVLQAHANELSFILTSEQGKPLQDAKWDVLGGAGIAASIAELELPQKIVAETPEHIAETRRVPIGVVGAITPWNVPVALTLLKVAPALLAGNTVVAKPSPFTPLTVLKIGELLRDALPPGVLNIISGGDQLGPQLTSHTGVDKISFTGSTRTGRAVMAGAASTLKRLTLELGGNDPAIVLSDVDIPTTAEKLFWAGFYNSGQICMASKRVYIHSSIYEPMKEALIKVAEGVRVGNGAEQGVALGPVQNKQQYDRVIGLIENAKQSGLTVVQVGEQKFERGYFVPPTFVDNPPDDARIVREEQFGPVMPLLKFTDIDDVVARANASEYGLGSSVWSSDVAAARSVGERLEAGVVWLNEAQFLPPNVPFGGQKQSGLGSENGIEGLVEFTSLQTITTRKS